MIEIYMQTAAHEKLATVEPHKIIGGEPTLRKEHRATTLANAIKDDFRITNTRQITKLLKRADQTIYSGAKMPKLHATESWINGGHTKSWFDSIGVTSKQLFFIEQNGRVVVWIKVSVRDVKKLAKSPGNFASAIHNLAEQLKNNIGAVKLAQDMVTWDAGNAKLHKQTAKNRKLDAIQMIAVIDKILREKRKFVGKHQSLLAKSLNKIAQYKATLATM